MFSRKQINIFVIIIISISIPAYYKTKSYLLGMATLEQIFSVTIFYDIGLGFGLGLLAIGTHELAVHILRRYFPEKSQHTARFIIQFSASTITSITAIYLFTHMYFLFIAQDFVPPPDFYLEMFVLGLLIPIFINGVKESLYFYGEWENESAKKEKLLKENIQAQYEVLKNQINPHFLFNCFNTLTELAHEDKKLTIEFIQQLSKVYRFVLENKDMEVVALDNELNVLQSYIFLQKIRFGDHIKIDMLTDNTTLSNHTCIVPLTLQILMENAVKHNIASKDQPLHITIELTPNNELVFKNNLQKKPATPSTNIGLQNIIKRYKVVAEKTIEVIETTSEFIVKIPLIKVQTA